MTAATNTERGAKLRAERKAAGLVRFECWIKPETRQACIEAVDRVQREAKDAVTGR